MAEKEPHIAVVVLNRNGVTLLPACLASVFKSRYGSFAVIVVDNASDDGSVAWLKREYPREIASGKLSIVENPANYGWAAGNNAGIQTALRDGRVEYVCLLNNDTDVHVEWLTEMVSVAAGNPGADVIGPKIYYRADRERLACAGGRLNMWLGATSHVGNGQRDVGQYDDVRECDYVTGAAMLIRRRTLEAVGRLDDAYYMYWDDVDFCVRARAAGHRVAYAPAAKVWHDVGGTGGYLSNDYVYYMVRNGLRFMKLHAKRPHWVTFVAAFPIRSGVGYAGLLLQRGRVCSARFVLLAVADFLRGVTGIRPPAPGVADSRRGGLRS